MLVSLIHWIEQILTHISYGGVFLLMAVDSMNIPIPSEVILSFTGFLVGQQVMNVHLAVFVSALGGTLGSLISYAIAYWGGRPLIDRYGKYLLIHKHDVAIAERWVARHGEIVFFFGRFIPVVRTFISLPAGVLRARLVPFVFYSFLGTLLWSYPFVLLGMVFGERWVVIEPIMERFQWAVMGMLALGVVWYVHHHVKKRGKLIP